jgi:hypothetical protein
MSANKSSSQPQAPHALSFFFEFEEPGGELRAATCWVLLDGVYGASAIYALKSLAEQPLADEYTGSRRGEAGRGRGRERGQRREQGSQRVGSSSGDRTDATDSSSTTANAPNAVSYGRSLAFGATYYGGEAFCSSTHA